MRPMDATTPQLPSAAHAAEEAGPGSVHLDGLLAAVAPFDVRSSTDVGADGTPQFAFWLADGLVHGTGPTEADAREDFLDALEEYAEDWHARLSEAPNHAHNRMRALRVSALVADRTRLAEAVFPTKPPGAA